MTNMQTWDHPDAKFMLSAPSKKIYPKKHKEQKGVRCMQLSNPRSNPWRIWHLFGLYVF